MITVRPASWSSRCCRGWAQAAGFACAVALAGCGGSSADSGSGRTGPSNTDDGGVSVVDAGGASTGGPAVPPTDPGEGAPVLGCQVDDKLRLPGESFDCPDTCNECQCTEQGVRWVTTQACTMVSLPTSCDTGSDSRAIGEQWTCGDGCNLCECVSGGAVIASLRGCDAPHACDGNFHVRTQAALDVLSTCSSILGNLYVSADLDLEPLANLEHVEGILSLYNGGEPGFTSLRGLRSLNSAGALWLSNVLISNFEDLAALSVVGNDAFEFGGGLEVDGAENLVDLSGLRDLTRLDGLRLVGLPNLVSLRGANLPSRVGSLSLIDLPALESTEISGGAEEVGDLTVWNCAKLARFDVERPLRVESAWLQSNPVLSALPFLQESRELQQLWVQGNPMLESLNLPSLEAVHGPLKVVENDNLVELELTSLRSARPFSIVGNPRLPTASVEVIAAQLDEQSRPKVARNAGDTLGLRNPCPWTSDGECDERSLCAQGTDSEDCNLR